MYFRQHTLFSRSSFNEVFTEGFPSVYIVVYELAQATSRHMGSKRQTYVFVILLITYYYSRAYKVIGIISLIYSE